MKNISSNRVTEILTVIKLACDNDATPYYALIICVWGRYFRIFNRSNLERDLFYWTIGLFQELLVSQ